MNFDKEIQERVNQIINRLRKEQQPDGAWRYCLKGSIVTDAYLIVLLRTLHIREEKLIRDLAGHIASNQGTNGAWKHYPDEPQGNLSATIEAYYALLFSGHSKRTDPHMQKARAFILANGGLGAANLFCQALLAVTGQIPWPLSFRLPVEIALLPPSSPISLYGLAVHIRAFMVPILLMADRKFSIRTAQTPDLSELTATHREPTEPPAEIRSLHHNIKQLLQQLFEAPQALHKKALRHLERHMLDRIESDGTLQNLGLPTVLMVFALVALGYERTHPLIHKAIQGLKGMCSSCDGHQHLQVVNATVWDTALSSSVLQASGVPPTDPVIAKASEYLLSQQHQKYGDWAINTPHVAPGGWGMSDFNSLCPDIDDTVAALNALFPAVQLDPNHRNSWQRGFHWLMSMQNDDGGWSAYEKNADPKLLQKLSMQGMSGLTDPSTSDMTGKVLEMLGNKCGLTLQDAPVQRAVKWLLEHQERDGSWYGRWGICYLHGTSHAVRGLLAVGLSPDHPAIQKAVHWLESIQQPDGGWGESCHSDIVRKYVPLTFSTPSQTAWAVSALITASTSPSPSPAILRGIQHLLKAYPPSSEASDYPNGNGYSKFIYFQYSVTSLTGPLFALKRYQKKWTFKK